MKQAVIAASFGTTHLDALKRDIAPVEEALRATLGLPVFRALTSPTVRRALERKGVPAPGLDEALQTARLCGMEEVLVQPTHLLRGLEYEKLCRQAMEAGAGLRVRTGVPLLENEEDLEVMARILLSEHMPARDEALVLAGHGTSGGAAAVYERLESRFHALGASRVFVGTVEGEPGLVCVRKALRSAGIQRVCLKPLLLVAGEHARADLAGESPDSWKSALQSDGLQVTCDLRGLGSMPAVRALIVAHARRALEA